MKNPLMANGRGMQMWNLYPLLGLKPGHHLPDEGTLPREINGVTVWVLPKVVYAGRRAPHRVMARCPKCSGIIPFGKLGQHVKRRDHA